MPAEQKALAKLMNDIDLLNKLKAEAKSKPHLLVRDSATHNFSDMLNLEVGKPHIVSTPLGDITYTKFISDGVEYVKVVSEAAVLNNEYLAKQTVYKARGGVTEAEMDVLYQNSRKAQEAIETHYRDINAERATNSATLLNVNGVAEIESKLGNPIRGLLETRDQAHGNKEKSVSMLNPILSHTIYHNSLMNMSASPRVTDKRGILSLFGIQNEGSVDQKALVEVSNKYRNKGSIFREASKSVGGSILGSIKGLDFKKSRVGLKEEVATLFGSLGLLAMEHMGQVKVDRTVKSVDFARDRNKI